MDILALFQCLQPHVTATTLRQGSRIAFAMLVMTGRVTMLGLSRWAGKGGSYRTVQRFFSTVIPWATLFWVFFRQQVYRPEDVYLMVKTNLRTQAQVILFSSDLTLAYGSLVDYYGLRFQIEFNFRDAKQYWGLEDFMNVTPPGVTNAATLSLFMVNVAYRLQVDMRQRDPD